MSKHSAHPSEPEEVTTPNVLSIMRRAARGHADSLAALQELIDLRTLNSRPTKEAKAAQAYAREAILSHRRKLKVEEDRLRRLLDDALEGSRDALFRLDELVRTEENRARRSLAREISWFVKAKWKENGWSVG